MKLGTKRWKVAPGEAEAEARLRSGTGCSQLAARLLVNRGICEPDAASTFFKADYSLLPDPLLLPDAPAAVERLMRAIASREKVWIHGDYDADGVTSAAIWIRLFGKLGVEVHAHVPHRIQDGYDLSSKFVQQASAAGATLIITTDCGIRRYDEVKEAKQAGIDVIITDHHEPGEELPPALAVVNPHRKDSTYPFPDLAGVGVAFRLGEALVRALGYSVDGYRRQFADLAAIGTVADVMPIVGDNRVIVKHGLEAMRNTKNLGIQQLVKTSGAAEKVLNPSTIGFRIGPRLNAIGRVHDPRIALNLLTTNDPVEAALLAQQLEAANDERRTQDQRILGEALQKVSDRDLSDTYCLVLADTTWHPGVIGIVASKVVERTGRPVILISLNEETGEGRGSARSISPFHMLDAVTNCREHLITFGGHSHAAGLTITRENVDGFAQAMNRYAAERLVPEDFIPVLTADAEVSASDVTQSLLDELEQFEPWGRGNEGPMFISHGVKIVEALKIGTDKQHLKLRVRDGSMQPVDALLWNHAELADHLHAGDTISICYRPEINHFNGTTRLQFMIEDLRPGGMEDW